MPNIQRREELHRKLDRILQDLEVLEAKINQNGSSGSERTTSSSNGINAPNGSGSSSSSSSSSGTEEQKPTGERTDREEHTKNKERAEKMHRILEMFLSLGDAVEGKIEQKIFHKADEERLRRIVMEHSPQEIKNDPQEVEKWVRILFKNLQYGKFSEGNRVTLFDEGDTAFEDMLRAIDHAKQRIWLETYIMDNSHIAELFVQKLVAASNRGVDVCVIMDFFGSLNTNAKWVAELRKNNIDVVLFNPSYPGGNAVGPFTFRDHRKILIADDIGYCGSMNVAEEVGGPLHGTGKYYDVHAKLEGPAVADLAEVFRDSLKESYTGVTRPPIPPPPKVPGGSYVQILESNVRQGVRSAQKVIESSVKKASHSVHLTTAYFCPPGFLRRALETAAEKPVRISLLLSGKSDIPGDIATSTHLVERFLRLRGSQMEVRFLETKHMHAKHLVVDKVFASLGSYNWDRFSSRRNLEVIMTVFDHRVAKQLADMHTQTCQRSREFTLQDWNKIPFYERWYNHMAYLMTKFMGKNALDGMGRYNQKEKSAIRRTLVYNYLEKHAAENLATCMMWGFQ
eukprot:GDKI01037249.1.p1 GENE.GDKI01037249.1~~GDKI01037249.1.p1  ORF type:complete len:568 (+),score=126.61 GDKI01037249.1:186-1889(+)